MTKSITPLSHPHVFNLLKNKGETDSLSPSSKKKYDWICAQDHSWEAPVNSIVNSLTPCPYCGGRKAIAGKNDLETIYPHIAAEWHLTKNQVSASAMLPISNKKAWWKCGKGHEWETSINNRTYGQKGCPVCVNNVVLEGYNDVATTVPDLLELWDYSKNTLLPTEVSAGSNKKVFWRDPKCQHAWGRTVKNQVESNRLCPVCVGRSKVESGFNDAATLAVHLIELYHPTKNIVSLEELRMGSEKKIWWRCGRGHEWESPVRHQSKRKYACLRCAGLEVVEGYNDLATVSPQIAAQWHPTKNTPLTPNQVQASSGLKVWWRCEKKHEWKTTVASRKFTGCAVCSNRKTLQGFNDLETIAPQVAEQWHETKNGDHKPSHFTTGSYFAAWWKCKQGHEWKVNISSRFHKGVERTGCVECSFKRFRSNAENEIAEYVKHFLQKDIIVGSRTVLKGYPRMELDIYIPSHKIAIEYNGLYWHSDKNSKDDNKHYQKWEACRKNDIQLIQIWEDDWRDRREIVSKMLKTKLGVSEEKTTYARTTKVHIIEYKTALLFLQNNHIQGAARGTSYLALKDTTNNIVAVMVLLLQKDTGTWTIVRYATSEKVPGGFTKILAFAEKTYMPKKIITFSDNCISDGSLYKNSGFHISGSIKPDYFYFKQRVREHKFNYRIKRFQNDPSLIYQENLSEKELARLNNLHRIWDAGKIRWEKSFR